MMRLAAGHELLLLMLLQKLNRTNISNSTVYTKRSSTGFWGGAVGSSKDEEKWSIWNVQMRLRRNQAQKMASVKKRGE